MAFSEPMRMTCLKNITQEISAAGAALHKSSGGYAYNATATSLECMESLQGSCRGLQFKVSDASGCSKVQDFDIGLTGIQGCPQDPQQEAKLRESCHRRSISFAVTIYDGSFFVLESGTEMGEFGAVKAGDVVEIRLTAEDAPKIEYLKNKQLMYTSTKETPSQLCARVIAYSQTPLVEELQWISEPVQCAKGDVALMGFSGIFQHRHSNTLSKTERLPCSAFNATVRSKHAITDIWSERVGTSFVIAESEPGTGQNFAVGLASDPDRGSSLESLDHAIHKQGSRLKVLEKGVMQGEIHHHVEAGDRIDMILALDETSSKPKIQYYVNRRLLGEIHSEVHFPQYVKVCARSAGKLIEDLRWINRSQLLQSPSLRHVTSPASSLTDDAVVRMSQLEMTVSKLLAESEASRAEKASLEAKLQEMKVTTLGQAQLHEEISTLKTEVGALKQKAAEEQAQLREEARVEKECLEVQLEEMKAWLAAAKEASSAFEREKAEWQAERGALRVALEEKLQGSARSQGWPRFMCSQYEEPSVRPSMSAGSETSERAERLEVDDAARRQTQRTVPEKLYLNPMQVDSPEERLLAVLIAKAKLEVEEMQLRRSVHEGYLKVGCLHPSTAAESSSMAPERVSEDRDLSVLAERFSAQTANLLAVIEETGRAPNLEMVQQAQQQAQRKADSEAWRALIEEKAQLEMELKAVRAENEQLQQHQTKIEELHRQACKPFPTKATTQSSEADSSEWEALPPASAATTPA